ncbi:MAG TPA: ABC transporter permease subunit [Gemmataceae bacterium]|nr:ABC transporter permease subunit [Gemmataceae bacterium]
MSPKRLFSVFRLEMGQNVRRPIFWILMLALGLTAYGLSTGDMMITSGDSTVGGKKAWITSEFAVAQMMTMVFPLFYSFFIAVVAGMSVIHDDELKVGELLHATSLRPSEYVWGKFLAILASFVAVVFLHLLFAVYFNHEFPNVKSSEIRGDCFVGNYLRPTCVFVLPMLVFLAGTAFAVGEMTRKPILVFVLPVALLLACGFFLWEWAPTWLDPRIDRALMLVDPAGFRWLKQTWLKIDRGVDFYNHATIQFDVPFLASRCAFLVVGLLLVFLSQRHLTAVVRGSRQSARRSILSFLRKSRAAGVRGGADNDQVQATPPERALVALGMYSVAPGLFRGIFEVARIEVRGLRSQPGLYLFVPLILLQTIGTSLVSVGVFDTPLWMTPGTLAVGCMNTLTLLICLLLLFYTVESLQRERHTLFASIHHATPVQTASILFGKSIANSIVGAVILLAALIGCAIVLLVQGRVEFALRPFLLTWALLLPVTFFGWTAFTMAVLAVTRNRYTTYGICLGALIFTGYRQLTGHMNWVGNWDLWSVLRWSDMQVFELDGRALLLNRIMVLGLGVFFTALAVRWFPRRELDAGRTLQRFYPLPLLKTALRLLPYALVPLAAGIMLWLTVYQGFEGDAAKKREKDYWRKNLATWKDAPTPALTAVDLNVDLEPSRRWLHVRGQFDLRNHRDIELVQIPLTGGDHWEELQWTMNGEKYEPENRQHLFVFTPPKPLKRGDKLQIGFEYHGTFPHGVTKNGGSKSEFILPSAVVLTAFTPSFVPVLGYVEEIGIDEDNHYDKRVWPEKWYEGITDVGSGLALPFTTRMRITAPAEFTLNSVGTRVSDTVEDGKRTTVWQSDHPLRFFNIVAGRWAEKRGKDTVVYYYPGHTYNIDEISEALDAARHYYSEWFYPYPWQELKLSEFPNLASYAQGFGTNITFSEGIGFLTKSEPKTDLAFMVTAHEAAHQWWGNILLPGRGPGCNILSEGMAHFSTMLLFDQVKGPRGRIEFCKRIEEKYGQDRRVDSERPLVKIDGDRPGDTTVTYDKGGWVFWMLLRHMGRERALAGLQAFIRKYDANPDHPALEDFVASMRSFAPDPVAYDAFVLQWFFEVVMPEYQLSDGYRTQVPGEKAAAANNSLAAGGEIWDVAVHVENVGTGLMPVEIAALAGERFEEDGSASTQYRDARTSVLLGAGAGKNVTIRCDFKPDRVLVDPDALVFQLRRKVAGKRF